MAGYNRVIMVGNLTRDPEAKQLPSGQLVCQLGLASNRQYKNKQTGMMVQEVCFIDVDVFGPQAESCKQFLQKGRSILVEGRLKFDSWETPEKQKRSKYTIVADRVVFLGSGTGDSESIGQRAAAPMRPAAASSEIDFEGDVLGDEHSTGQNQKNSQGELSFKDEPPFQDDLPF